MMSLNLNNYESWFLDYHEGNLNEEQEKLLLTFLEQYPELKGKLDSFDNDIILQKHMELYDGKEKLKAPAAIDFDELLIAYIEGNLNPEENKKTAQIIHENKKLADDFSAYKKTFLKPDLTIIFPNKAKLKKGNGKIIQLMYYSSYTAAACLLLLLLINLDLFFTDPPLKKVENKTKDTIKINQYIKPGIPVENLVLLPNKTKEKRKKPVPSEEEIALASCIIHPIDSITFNIAEINTNNNSSKSTKTSSNLPDSLMNTDYLIEEVKNDIPLAENIPLIVVPNIQPKNQELPGKFFTPKELLIQELKKLIGSKEPATKKIDAKLNFWDLANAGAIGISKLTGKKLEFSHEINDEGKLSTLAIKSERFEFSRSYSK